MNDTFNAIVTGIARHILTTMAGYLVAHGYLQSSATEQFIGAGLVFVGIAWSYWKNRGQAQAAEMLKKVTNRKTTQAAVEAAQTVPPGSAVTPGLPARPV